MMELLGVPPQVLFGQLLLGLINGSFYALLSLGLAVIFGMLNVINFAHGEVVMIGAMVAFTVINALAPFGLPALAVVLIGAGCAPVLMASFYIFARNYPPAVFASLGGLMIGISSAGNIASAAPMATPSHDPMTPRMSAPTNTKRITCQRVAPATRSRPTSRARSPIVIDRVFTMTKAPTNRTIAAIRAIIPWKSPDDARIVAARSAGVARM